MVVNVSNGSFDAPIPGQSLTQHPGSSPMEYPPQFTDLDTALEYVWDRLHKPNALINLVGYLKAKTPVEILARTIIYQGLLKNNWNVDMSLLMLQGVIWQIEAIAKLKGIKTKTFVDDPNKTKSIVNISNLLETNKVKDDTLKETTNTKFKGFF